MGFGERVLAGHISGLLIRVSHGTEAQLRSGASILSRAMNHISPYSEARRVDSGCGVLTKGQL